MNARDSRLGLHGMQRGNVAVADYPLGIFLDELRVDVIHQLDGAVATTVAEDGLDACILEGLDKVVGAFLDGASEFARIELVDIFTDNRFEAPFPNDIGRFLDVGIGGGVRR